MGLHLGQVATKYVQVGGKLGRSWSQLVQVGGWPTLTPSRANVAAMLDRNGAFARCWADLHMQITAVPCTFLRSVPGEHAPPPPGLKLHQSDRPVRSYPSLPNYHASGAGGFFHVWGLFFIFKLDFWLWEFHHGSRSLSWKYSNFGLCLQEAKWSMGVEAHIAFTKWTAYHCDCCAMQIPWGWAIFFFLYEPRCFCWSWSHCF